MAELFHKTFVDAATGANGFAGVSASNGTIAHSAGAGLNGTSGGVTFTRTGASPNLYGYLQPDMSAATVYRTAFFLDFSAMAIGTSTHSTRLHDYAGTAPALCSLIMLRNLSGVLNVQHYLVNDSAVQSINAIPVSGYPAWMEVRVKRSSGVGVADAESQLYYGGGDYAATGELISTHTGIVCYTNFVQDTYRIGMRTGGASVTGSVIFDEWALRNDDTPILYGVSASTFSPLTWLRRRRR